MGATLKIGVLKTLATKGLLVQPCIQSASNMLYIFGRFCLDVHFWTTKVVICNYPTSCALFNTTSVSDYCLAVILNQTGVYELPPSQGCTILGFTHRWTSLWVFLSKNSPEIFSILNIVAWHLLGCYGRIKSTMKLLSILQCSGLKWHC